MRIRHIAASAIVLSVVAAGLTVGETAANAYTSPEFNIKSQNSGKCLDVYNWSKSAGANVDQWTCGDDHANQEWQLIENSNGITFWIRNVNSGMCLQPETNEVGTYVVQDPCSSKVLQEWFVVPVTNTTVTYQNANWPASQPVGLDVTGASKANHAWIDIWYINWNSNQVWTQPPGFS